MPEAPEVDTDRLHEQIEEEVERGGEASLKAIALTTALFAVLAAVVALRAAGTVNEALFLKAEATRFQAEASDQWAAYQAKRNQIGDTSRIRIGLGCTGQKPASLFCR